VYVFYCINNHFSNELSSPCEDLPPIISLPDMLLLPSRPRSSSQSAFECLSQLYSSIQQFSSYQPLLIGLQLKFVKVKSLICGADASVKVVTTPKKCSLLIVEMSFQSSSDCENNSCMPTSGIEGSNLLQHFVKERGGRRSICGSSSKPNKSLWIVCQAIRPDEPSGAHSQAQRQPKSSLSLFPNPSRIPLHTGSNIQGSKNHRVLVEQRIFPPIEKTLRHLEFSTLFPPEPTHRQDQSATR
jgi:hypothetical protein